MKTEALHRQTFSFCTGFQPRFLIRHPVDLVFSIYYLRPASFKSCIAISVRYDSRNIKILSIARGDRQAVVKSYRRNKQIGL